MKNFVVILFLALLFSCKPKPEVKDASIDLFTRIKSPTELKGVDNYTSLEINEAQMAALEANTKDSITINLPIQDTTIKLNLVRQNLFADDFKAQTDAGEVSYDKGSHYKGTIDGNAASYVTFSVVGGEIAGIAADTVHGTLNIGKQDDNYIVVAQSVEPLTFECSTPESAELDALRSQVENDIKLQATSGACVTEDFELTYGVYTHFGNNTQKSIDWFTSIFAGVQSLFTAASIDIRIKTIYVWTTPDGYSANNGTALNEFMAKRQNDPNFTANLAHLVRGQSGGAIGGIAYVGTLCVPSYRFGLSEPLWSFNQLPAYSWSTEVLTHEIGHNLGSPHTHSCSWPGGPIDNCMTQEGNCPPGPTPAKNGGTIMSYCHLNGIGINFALGFGPLPGALILSKVNSGCFVSACLTTPPPVPTCTDGIKNGTETGIDCGGTCPPCPIIPPSSPNIALNKKAFQSTNYPGDYTPGKAVDGDKNTFQHTTQEQYPWWYVDLGTTHKLSNITIINRLVCCGSRIREFKVFVSATPITDYNAPGHIYYFNKNAGLGEGTILSIPNTTSGRYVSICVKNFQAGDFMHLAEVIVNGTPDTNVPPPPQYCDTTFKVLRPVDSIGKGLAPCK